MDAMAPVDQILPVAARLLSTAPRPSPQQALDMAAARRSHLGLADWIEADPAAVAHLVAPNGATALSVCARSAYGGLFLALAPLCGPDALTSQDATALFGQALLGMAMAVHANMSASQLGECRKGVSEVALALVALDKRSAVTDAFWRMLHTGKQLDRRCPPAEDAVACALWEMLTPAEKKLLWRRRSPEGLPQAWARSEAQAMEAAMGAPFAGSSPAARPRRV